MGQLDLGRHLKLPARLVSDTTQAEAPPGLEDETCTQTVTAVELVNSCVCHNHSCWSCTGIYGTLVSNQSCMPSATRDLTLSEHTVVLQCL